jgi:hypothetical protein
MDGRKDQEAKLFPWVMRGPQPGPDDKGCSKSSEVSCKAADSKGWSLRGNRQPRWLCNTERPVCCHLIRDCLQGRHSKDFPGGKTSREGRRREEPNAITPAPSLHTPSVPLLLPNSSSTVLTRLSGPRSRPTTFFLVDPGIEPRTSGSVARNSDH